jgi:hypothetical protein
MYLGIKSLARQLRDARETGDPCPAVFLGAGASLASGNPMTRQALEEILLEACVDAPGAMSDMDLVTAFFDLVDQAGDDERYKLTERYQRQASPPSGYKHLARLVAEGYFDTIVTSSFDTFLEDALSDAGLRANELMILDASYEKIPKRRRKPQVQLLKLHGDPYGEEYLSLMSEVELTPATDELLSETMKGHLLMVGYHPRDEVINASLEGGWGDTWYVNPEEPGPDHPLEQVLEERGARLITGEAGYSDRFFGEMADSLLYRGDEIKVAQTVGMVVGGSVVGVKIGKFGDSVAQVGVPQFTDAAELEEAPESGPIISEDQDTLAEEDEDETAALIASLERQREALEYDYWKLEKEIARYGLRAPQAVLNERESIRREIELLDKEMERLRSEEE